MRRLIVNADDLGMTAGVTNGVVAALEGGVVTSASAMVCRSRSAEHVRAAARRLPRKLGVHLQLSAGAPVSSPERVASLVDASGRFPRHLVEDAILDEDEAFSEWSAQVEAAIALGLSPTHVDSHHGIHRYDSLLAVYCAVARRYGLKARGGSPALATRIRAERVVCPDICEARWTMSGGPLDALCERLRAAYAECGDDCVVELVTHPGHVDDELREVSSYSDGRAGELAVLCAPETAAAFDDMGIERIGFADP